VRIVTWDIVAWMIALVVLILYFVGYALPYQLT
jgi:hypothetical protein